MLSGCALLDASRSKRPRVPINYVGIQNRYSRKEHGVETYNLLFSTLNLKNKKIIKQQELKSTNTNFSLIFRFHYTHQNLSPGSYKILSFNAIHYRSFLYCRHPIHSAV